jgi:hypothetical protein
MLIPWHCHGTEIVVNMSIQGKSTEQCERQVIEMGSVIVVGEAAGLPSATCHLANRIYKKTADELKLLTPAMIRYKKTRPMLRNKLSRT